MRMVWATIIAGLALATPSAVRTETTTRPGVRSAAGAVVLVPAHTAVAQAPAQLTGQDLEARMKNIGKTFPAMQMHLTANQLGDAAKDAQDLAVWFGDVERFWAQNNKPDAVKWAQNARASATQVAGAATAGNGTKARQAAGTMSGVCEQCHGKYREMGPAGGFRIRPGVLPAE